MHDLAESLYGQDNEVARQRISSLITQIRSTLAARGSQFTILYDRPAEVYTWARMNPDDKPAFMAEMAALYGLETDVDVRYKSPARGFRTGARESQELQGLENLGMDTWGRSRRACLALSWCIACGDTVPQEEQPDSYSHLIIC